MSDPRKHCYECGVVNARPLVPAGPDSWICGICEEAEKKPEPIESRIKCETCRYGKPMSILVKSGPWGARISWRESMKCVNSSPFTEDCSPCGQWKSSTSNEEFDDVYAKEKGLNG